MEHKSIQLFATAQSREQAQYDTPKTSVNIVTNKVLPAKNKSCMQSTSLVSYALVHRFSNIFAHPHLSKIKNFNIHHYKI